MSVYWTPEHTPRERAVVSRLVTLVFLAGGLVGWVAHVLVTGAR